MTRLALVIDEDYCWGCRTCEVACKQENLTPYGIKLLAIRGEVPREADGRLNMIFRALVCRHCDDPPCLEACPAGAIAQRPDGIVVLDEAGCTGCQSCLEACPHGAIGFDPDRAVALKCNLCHHRVDRGLLPACADNVCLAHCIHFGDPADMAAAKSGLRRSSPIWTGLQDKQD